VSDNLENYLSSNNQPSEISLHNCVWRRIPDLNKQYFAQIRYHGEIIPIKIKKINQSTNTAIIIPSKPVFTDHGQSMVIYDKDNLCLGGGLI